MSKISTLFTKNQISLVPKAKVVADETPLTVLPKENDFLLISGSDGYCDYFAVQAHPEKEDYYLVLPIWKEKDNAETMEVSNLEGSNPEDLFYVELELSQDMMQEMVNRSLKNKDEFDFIQTDEDGNYEINCALLSTIASFDHSYVNSDEREYYKFVFPNKEKQPLA